MFAKVGVAASSGVGVALIVGVSVIPTFFFIGEGVHGERLGWSR